MNATKEVSSNDPVWAVIGKIGAFVSLVIALFTLYAQIDPDKAKLNASCQVVDVDIQPAGEGSVQSRSPSLDLKSSKSSKAKSAAAGKQGPTKEDVENTGSKADSDVLDEVLSRKQMSVLQCEVANSGRQEAKDVVMDLAVAPKAAKVNGKILSRKDIIDSSLPIGTIRPNGKISVRAWFESYEAYSARREESYSISFSGGLGSVQMMHPTFGWIASIAKFLDFVSKPWVALAVLFAFSPYFGPVVWRLFFSKVRPSQSVSAVPGISVSERKLNFASEVNETVEAHSNERPVRTWKRIYQLKS